MISFDSINFQWETQGEQKRLIIVVRDVPHTEDDQKEFIETSIKKDIKKTFLRY